MKNHLRGQMEESMGVGVAHTPRPSAFQMETAARGVTRFKHAFLIPLAQLVPDPDQPRKEFDEEELDKLAGSLRDHGQILPIRVRRLEGTDTWRIIVGERRYRAALRANLPELVCVESTREMTAEEILEEQVIENCLRGDLKPVEQARAFEIMMANRGWSYRDLAAHLHLPLSQISKTISLLKLPPEVQVEVDRGNLNQSIAYEVSRIADPEEQREVASLAIEGGLTLAEVTATRRPSAKKRTRYTTVTFEVGQGQVTVRTLGGVIDALSEALSQAREQEAA